MPTLEDAIKILKDYQKTCTEIELKDTAEWLENIINQAQERIAKSAMNDLLLSELFLLQDQLRKTPINLENVACALSDKVHRAQEFFKKAKTLLANSKGREIDALAREYQEIQVKIPDFEKLQKKIEQENNLVAIIKGGLKSVSLTDLIIYRKQIQGHQYNKDPSLEFMMLSKQVELLHKEYLQSPESRSDKPMFDLIGLVALLREFEDSIKHHNTAVSLKLDASEYGLDDPSKSTRFLSNLIEEVKKYLNDSIYTLSLENVKQIKNHSFKNFVDLTNEITDHKIRLEIGGKDYDPFNKNPDAHSDNKKIQKVLGKEFALISRLEDEEQGAENGAMALEGGEAQAGKQKSPESTNVASGKKKGQVFTSGALISTIQDDSPQKRVLI